MKEEAKQYLKKIEEICRSNSYSIGPNRHVEADGFQIQVYVDKHGLKVQQETHPDPYYEGETISTPYIGKKDAESLIPAVRESFSKLGVIGKVTLFSTGDTPSYFLKIAYPPGVTQYSVRKALSK